jgi:hypothetical protein
MKSAVLNSAYVKAEAQHPTDDDLRALTLGQLTTVKSLQVQRHLFNCGNCLKRLIEAEVLLALAEGVVVPKSPLVYNHRECLFVRHDTADGFIYARVERSGRKWIARHWGQELQGARECRTMREANEHAVTAFREMFPEHRCTARCCVNPESAA